MGRRLITAVVAFAIALIGLPFGAAPAAATSPDLVISQIYGAGGNTGATLQNDYIEIFNRGTVPVSLGGRSLQYASATGTGNFGITNQLTVLPSVTLNPGQYFLVQEAGGAVGAPLPPADLVVTTGVINMSGSAGKVALVNSTVTLGCNGGSTLCSPAQLALIVDLIGYGSANFFEGAAAAPGLTATAAALRANGGCTDTDNNAADFTAAAPSPRNSAAPLNACPSDTAPAVASTNPSNGASGISVDANITITFTEPVNVSGSWFTISCTSTGGHTATFGAGPTTFTLDPATDFASAESCTVTVIAAQVSDQDTIDPPDTMAQNAAWSFSTISPPIFIHDVQGAAHTSPKVGMSVKVSGIVTAKRSNGFYLQEPDAEADADVATSEGVFVFTLNSPTSVSVGDAATVTGTVSEFRPGGASTANLTTTELTGPTIVVQSTGNLLPTPMPIGAGGRVPPTEVIENDASGGDVETSGVFDPAQDGIDFWESLEGMRVTIANPAIVGPSNSFNEISVLADGGAGATGRTARGGIVISASDSNPEKIVLDDEILKLLGMPFPTQINVGDSFSGSVTGVVDYNFGLFMVELTASPTKVSAGLAREVAGDPGPQELAIATFNVENLDPNDGTFAKMADLIVNNLRSPDVISLEEIQDNNGATNDSTVDATTTLALLRDAVIAASGPTYSWREIDPVDDQDGGEPGGNIRQVFFFRTDRGLTFVDRLGATSTTPNAVVNAGGPQLLYSPGRIDPTNSAFNSSRKPLAAEFTYNGHHVFVVANHFNSKGGDDPLWGRHQPPLLASELQRQQQANIVKAFVQQILGFDANAEVVVLGDLNDFEWSNPLMALKSAPGPLNDLIETLPANERYTYVFEGNSQTLDHILVSDRLLALGARTDVVHVNAEFWDQASDHDPQVAMLPLRDTVPPTFTSVPAAQTYFTGPAATICTVLVTDDMLGVPTATDNASGVSITPSGVPAGNLFPCGVTIVSYVASDDAGNTATATQSITVIDNTPPVISAPPSVVVRTSDQLGQCTASVATNATATDNSGFVTISVTGAPAGNVFPLGTTTVTYTAADAAGNIATATQSVTLVDDTRPTITAPANVIGAASGITTLVTDAELGTATAADNCPGVTIARSGVPAGNLFPHGTTTITYTTTDASGNTASATQTVTVNATATSVCVFVRSYIANAGIANSLCVKLDAAAAARARGSVNAHDNVIDAFANEVDAQRRNGTLTGAQADALIALARTL